MTRQGLWWRLSALAAASVLAACSTRFEIKDYAGSTDRLYAASLNQFKHHHWEESVQGFERLTLDLPAHDTLFPLAYFYLGYSHRHNAEPLLGAQAFQHLAEGFPDDTLAPLALYESGNSYASMWRRPSLDAQYGQSALSEYQQLVALYPASPLKDTAEREINRLQEWFAIKDLQTAIYYLKRSRGYPDPAVIYFKDVVKNYPETPAARRAYLYLARIYKMLHYREEEADVCHTLQVRYPKDPDTQKTCPAVVAGETAATPATPKP